MIHVVVVLQPSDILPCWHSQDMSGVGCCAAPAAAAQGL